MHGSNTQKAGYFFTALVLARSLREVDFDVHKKTHLMRWLHMREFIQLDCQDELLTIELHVASALPGFLRVGSHFPRAWTKSGTQKNRVVTI